MTKFRLPRSCGDGRRLIMSTSPAFEDWVARARAVPIEREIERRGIKLNGGKIERCGPCPRCGGTDRFSVNFKKQVFNCRRCGAKGDIIDLVRFLDDSDFITAGTTLTGEPPPKGNGKHRSAEPKKVVAAKFGYEGVSGELLFVVERVEFQNADGTYVEIKKGKRRKVFRQKRSDPDKPGQWIWNIDGVPVVPYRLPELIEAIAAGHTIFIPEGEAKADLLWSWNMPATCCAGGAKKWKPEHSEFLRGANVVILPDADKPGREHADVVAASLKDIAASVRVLDLPGLAEKEDIVDWAAAGGTAEQLWQLAEQARPWTPLADEPPEEEEPADLGEWDAGDDPGPIPPRQWLLANQFCCGFISSIVSAGGGGKSALRLLQLISLALGRSLCGQHVFRRCRVLLVSLEDDRDEIQRRIKATLNYYGVDRSELKGWLFCATPKLAKLAQMNGKTRVIGPLELQLRDAIVRRKPDIISLDPFIKTHSLAENDSGDMDFVCDLLAKFAIEFNIAVDSPHHVHKGALTPGDADSGRGSTGIRDAGRLVYTLAFMSEDEARIFGIAADDRWSYVRLDSAKVNITTRSAKPAWFQLVGVPIGNATDLYPHGDTVQTVEPWTPPDVWKDLSIELLNRILTEIDGGLPDGNRYTHASNAEERAAWKIVVKHAPNKTETQAREVIKMWMKNGVLVSEDYENPKTRKPVKGLRVDDSKRPG